MRSCLRLIWCVVLAGVASAQEDVVASAVAHARAHPQGDAPASFVAADYRRDLRDLPIGVFDSGVGGLTVLEAIKAHDRHHNLTGADGADGVPDFAGESFVYFGDQANMPYGNYSAVGRTDFLRELVLRDALFLLGRRHARGAKPPVKAIVIACNTATAYGLEDIRSAVKAWGVPVIVVGVVEAGAQGLAETAEGAQGGVAVLATVGTCASNAYPKAIAKVSGRPVRQLGSATLAAAIEGDPSVKTPIREIIRAEVGAFLQSAVADRAAPIDTLMLGCTHYPLVAGEISEAFAYWRDQPDADGRKPYAELVAPKLKQVNPAAWTAEALWRSLHGAKTRVEPKSAPLDRFFVSVPNPAWRGVGLAADGSLAYEYKYGRQPGQVGREDTINVPLTAEMLPAPTARLVREMLPLTWKSLQAS
ncbi:MAG: glutamate racemase, partial [Opitutales bacterium]